MSDEGLKTIDDKGTSDTSDDTIQDFNSRTIPGTNEDIVSGSDEVGQREPGMDKDAVLTATDQGTLMSPPDNSAFSEVAQQLDAQSKGNDDSPYDGNYTIVSHLDPARQVDPHGIYLDDVERRNAEIRRAKAEGREPDLDNPGSYAGDVVVPTQVAKGMVNANVEVPVSFTIDSDKTEAAEVDSDVDDPIDPTGDSTENPNEGTGPVEDHDSTVGK